VRARTGVTAALSFICLPRGRFAAFGRPVLGAGDTATAPGAPYAVFGPSACGDKWASSRSPGQDFEQALRVGRWQQARGERPVGGEPGQRDVGAQGLG